MNLKGLRPVSYTHLDVYKRQEYGREQAKETGQKILAEGIKADEILCSPLSRAADTARLISEMTGIPYRVEPRLIEQNFGKWESTPRDGKDFKKAKEFFACSHEGGESTLLSLIHIWKKIKTAMRS